MGQSNDTSYIIVKCLGDTNDNVKVASRSSHLWPEKK